MKHVKLFSAHTDDADDAARELQQLLGIWCGEFQEAEIESATTTISVANETEEMKPIVCAILTVVFNVTEPPLEG